MKDLTIGFIGLGLIGGSLYLKISLLPCDRSACQITVWL